MSYVSGFMMGAAIGKSIRQMMDKKPRQPLPAAPVAQQPRSMTLVAATPGRRRYRLTGVSAELGKLIEDNLSKVAFIESVRFNAVTGSMLFIYDAPEAKMDELADMLCRRVLKLAGIGTAQAPAGQARAAAAVSAGQEMRNAGGAAASPSAAAAGAAPIGGGCGAGNADGSRTLGNSIRQSVYRFSDTLKSITGGRLDVTSLFTLIFIARGIRKIFLFKQYPSGPQMLWWAVSLLRGWRFI